MGDFGNAIIGNEKNDIVFFKKVNAGKRIYYIDVKRNKKDELFLSITESKKVFNDENSEEAVFEKHKIFLYKEDFDKFINALNESLEYIREQNKISAIFPEGRRLEPETISLNLNFWRFRKKTNLKNRFSCKKSLPLPRFFKNSVWWEIRKHLSNFE